MSRKYLDVCGRKNNHHGDYKPAGLKTEHVVSTICTYCIIYQQFFFNIY
jgi:hypothetical protein